MFFAMKRSLRIVAALAVCISIATAHAFAYDTNEAEASEGDQWAIAPVSSVAPATGTVLNASQIDAAEQAVAEAKAVEEAAQAAAEEAARRAALTYQPVYGGTVNYSSAKSASEIIHANGRSMGQYKLTFYCPCSSCSGGWGDDTSSGVRATEGRTIAVDPRKIPIGSRVFIEGFGDFIAEDVGGAIKGNRIDVYLNSHSRCYDLGVKYANVYVMS